MISAQTVTAAASALGLVLSPFGQVGTHLTGNEPWRGADSVGAVFVILRAQRIPKTTSGVGCSRLLEALPHLDYGKRFDAPGDSGDFSGWEPWEEKERQSIRSCSSSPCDVKLDKAESHAMSAAPPEKRQAEYLKLVTERASHYSADGTRKPYEFPGGIVDPWHELERRGFKSGLPMPERAELSARVLRSRQGGVKPVRQILDRRVRVTADDGDLWIRDAYSNHHFDGWGERIRIGCDPSTGEAILIHGLVFELDQMKETDFISKLGRPRMRSGVQQLGQEYLDERARELKRLAEGTGK